jgi:hypothetical protein
MNTIQKFVTIPTDRRLRLDLSLPDTIPPGASEMLLVFSPVRKTRPENALPLSHFAGSLSASATFAGDPVALQRKIRDEW